MIDDREFENVIALPAPDRYEHFIRTVGVSEQLWALNSPDGWLLLGDDEDHDAFPVWPAERYATAYAESNGCIETAEPIPLSTWKDEMLPQLAADGVLVATFPTSSDGGIVLSALEQLVHLEELNKSH